MRNPYFPVGPTLTSTAHFRKWWLDSNADGSGCEITETLSATCDFGDASSVHERSGQTGSVEGADVGVGVGVGVGIGVGVGVGVDYFY